MTDDQLFGEVDLEIENQRLREENQKLQGKIKRLNAFIVEKNLAIEYIRWQKGSGDDWWVNVFIASIVSEMITMGNVVFVKIPIIIQEVGIWIGES